jgi:hypothetical protein
VISNVAYLIHIRFDKFQSVAVNCTAPLSQLIFDTPCRSPNPMQFEVEASRRIVNDIVMKYDDLSLIASLNIVSVGVFQ